MNKSLNTFRLFAFLGVLLFHAAHLGFGYLGVNSFFVLSGYLITPILLDTKKQLPSFKSFLANFYGRRFFRIFPAYYLYLLLVTIVIYAWGLQNQGDYLLFIKQLPWSATYTQDFYQATKYFYPDDLIVHFWSLAVEEQFYIFWPLVIFFVSESNLKHVFIGLIIAGPLIRFFTGFIVDHHLISFINPWKELTIYVLPTSHIDAFVIGGFFSVYIKEYVPTTKTIVWSFIAIIAVGIITSYAFSSDFKLTSFGGLGYASLMNDSYKYVWGYSVFSVFFSLLLLRLSKRDLWPAIFENNILNYLGKITYGLYIYHFFILRWVILNVHMLHIDSPSLALQRVCNTVLTLILTIVVSILSYELFEKKMIRLKDKYFPKHNPAGKIAQG